MTDKHLYRFGDFQLCVEERGLRRGEENISLTPKMYDLLLVLVQNADRIVEKEFLLKTVWPDSFVEEGNITFNIRQLRVALGDSAQRPIYIETIPRRGYRFLAKVEEFGEAEAECETASKTTEECECAPNTYDPVKWVASRPVLTVAMLVVVVALSGSLVWYSRGSAAQGAPILSAPFASEKLSTDGQVYHAVLTPDGKTLVYTHSTGAKQSLWLRQLENSNNIEIIPLSESFYGGLAISPDGNTVYFVRGLRTGSKPQIDVYRVPIVGGVPQKLVEATQGWISVSPAGDKISFVRCNYTDEEWCSLWTADAADGKNERKLLSRPRPFRIADNKISPDGRKIAFAVGQSRTASNEFSFNEVDIESGAERELTSQKFFNINYIAWLPDQSGCLITAQKLPDKNYRIWEITGGGEALILTEDSETYNRLSLDAKGSLLVSTRIEPDFKLHIYQTQNRDAPPQILANAASVSFAPDGKIIYSSRMTGDHEIWSVNPDGSDQRQLTHDIADDIAPVVSPDNRYIYYESNRSGSLSVWRMDIDGTDQVQITTQEGGFPLYVSPAGQWLYYRSGLHSTLRRVSLAGGNEEELVYDSSGADFALSPDTSRIALTKKNGDRYTFTILLLPTGRTEATFNAADPAKLPIYVIWTRDSRSLAYILADENEENRTLWFQSITGDAARQITDIRGGHMFELSAFAISYDGKSFATVQGTWNHNAVLIKGLKP